MKYTLRHIVNFYLYSSLHIGLCCVMLYLFSVGRLGIEVDYSYLYFLLSSTIFTYSIHRIIGMNKVKKFAHQGRYAVISKFRNHIITYAILSGIYSLYLYIGFSFARMQLLFSSGLISVLYTLPIFGKSMRLRDFSFIKIFLIAFVWAFVTESIPLYESGISLKWIVILFVERVAFFIAITIPFDIRDLKLDLTNNVKTLPSILGIRRSTYVALFLLMYCIGSEIYLDTNGIEGCIPTILAYILTGILLYRVYKKDNDYYFSGLMDGTIMLPWILMKILS